MNPARLLLPALVPVLAPLAPAADQAAAGLPPASGINAGLAVHLGTTDGKTECALTNDGRILVHGLATDPDRCAQARRTIFAHGLYGLASVATLRDPDHLPYASNLVNLLVADLDALGPAAPARAEMLRVLAPGGELMVCQNGGWTKSIKPRPPEIDDWGHFDHDAAGLGTSHDQLVDPVRQQQWITSLQPIPEEGNPAGYDPGGGMRIDGRFAVMDVNDSRFAADNTKKNHVWSLHCRDAFNGTPIWTIPREMAASRSRWSLAAEDGVVYAWLRQVGELTAIDLASGRTLRTYPGTAAPEAMTDGESLCVRVAGDTLLVGVRERLLCLDAHTAAIRWEFARDGLHLLGPVMDAARGRAYAIVAEPSDRFAFRGRWPASRHARAVVALDLASGRPVWECTAVASRELPGFPKGKGPRIRGIGQLLPGDRHLVVFGSKAISGGNSPYLGAIDLATGKLTHGTDDPFVPNYNVASYNALWRDGAAYFAGAFTNVWRYDPDGGGIEQVIRSSWNQRCTRLSATPRWLMFGQAAYYGPDHSGVQVSVGRAGCALPNTPANGMTYFTPTMCGCTTLVRGFQAMTGEAFTAPVNPQARLLGGGGPVALPATADLPAGPVADDWLKQDRAGERTTAVITLGGLALVAHTHQHRVEARRDGRMAWNFVADARISAAPVAAGGHIIFGCHDGWVYALGNDGSLQWKYLLAPAERMVGINGQLENAWPVYGVTTLDGRVIASAGTHVELDGGVTVAALDPASGEPAWVKHLAKHPSKVPTGGSKAKIIAHSFINSVPRVTADGMIELGDGGRRGGTFRFSPDDEEAALNARLNTPPPKKR